MIFSAFRSKIVWALIVAMGVMAAGALWYYRDTQAKLLTLEKENTALTQVNQENETVITDLKQDFAQVQTVNRNLSRKRTQLEQEVRELRERFAKHDVGFLAKHKPVLIEKIINKASQGVGNEIESITSNTSQ